MKPALLVYLIAFAVSSANAFLYSKSAGGKNIKWAVTDKLNLYVNPEDVSSEGIASEDVKLALQESLEQWNSVAPFPIKASFTQTPPAFGAGASLRFSSNPAYFGSGVLAVTSVSYNSSNGDIYSADIIMNDTGFNAADFTNSKAESGDSSAYVGDVITHELGHLLGLNHSEVAGASMTYSIFKNQYDIHEDDRSGIGSLYSLNSATGISGNIVTKGFDPVYGAHVQALDLDKNEIVAGVFADEQGYFRIDGLDGGVSYALYITPIRSKENLPSFLKTYEGDICNGKSFAPSFFSKCGGRGAGRAQVIQAKAGETVEVGFVAVRCATNVDPQYLSQKVRGEDSFLFFDYFDHYKSSTSFTGYFSPKEVSDSKADNLKIDLSGLSVDGLGQAYIKLNFSFENLGSALFVETNISSSESGYNQTFQPEQDIESGKYLLDYQAIVPLSADAGDNVFELSLVPSELSSKEKSEIFASPKVLTNENAIYFVSAQVMVSGPDGLEAVQTWSSSPYEDNSACLEGELGQTTQSYSPVSTSSDYSDQAQPLSCGTVDFDGGNSGGGGMGSFVLGLILASALFAFPSLFGGRNNDFFV